MFRHLQNVNELVIYATLSCGAAFVSRLFPAFAFPIFLLRVGVFGYCLFIVSGAEGNREVAITLGLALVIGMIGGNWDWIAIYLQFNQEFIGRLLSTFIGLTAVVLGVYRYGQINRK